MLEERCTLLPALSVVAVTGRDARAFMQGQLTTDLLGLERHPGLLTAACNREGRVLETMRLAGAPDGLLIIVRRTLIPGLLQRLAKHVLRAQVWLEDRSNAFSVAGLLDAQPDPSWSLATAAATGLTIMVAGPRRILLVGSPETLLATLSGVERTTASDWDRACIEDGEPTIHPETAGLWIPQMLNLDLLAAISFSKGCYLGQEIVARTQHLGRIKRRMLRYCGPADAALRPGQTLFAGKSAAAQVVAACQGPGGTEMLAVVALEYRAELLGARPGGSEFVPGDLPYAIPAPAADTEA